MSSLKTSSCYSVMTCVAESPARVWLRETVRVQYWRPKAKTIEVEAHMALICASTDDAGRPGSMAEGG